jgi:hypothetical protein
METLPRKLLDSFDLAPHLRHELSQWDWCAVQQAMQAGGTEMIWKPSVVKELELCTFVTLRCPS